MSVLGVIAVAELGTHARTASAFAANGQPHATAVAAGSIALLFVCGSQRGLTSGR